MSINILIVSMHFSIMFVVCPVLQINGDLMIINYQALIAPQLWGELNER